MTEGPAGSGPAPRAPASTASGVSAATPLDVRIPAVYWPNRLTAGHPGSIIVNGRAISFVFDDGHHLFDVPLSSVVRARRRRGGVLLTLFIGAEHFTFVLESAATWDAVRQATADEAGRMATGRTISSWRARRGARVGATADSEARQAWAALRPALTAGGVPLEEPRTFRTLLNYTTGFLIVAFTLSSVLSGVTGPSPHHIDITGIIVWDAICLGAYACIWLYMTRGMHEDL